MADRFKKKLRSAWVFLRPVGMKAAVSLLFASLVLFALLAGCGKGADPARPRLQCR